MNDPLDLMRRHRSIREYTADPVPDEHIRIAVEAGQMASSSSNIQAYCLIRITDPRKRETLIELTGGQPKVAACGAFFIVCGDTRRHRLMCERQGHAYEAKFEAFLLAAVDATLFAQNLVLAFEAQGYGICYIGGLRSHLAESSRLLGIHYGVYPLFGLCVGVPAEEPIARPRLPMEAIYFEDHYPDDETMWTSLERYDRVIGEYEQERGGPAQAPWSTRMGQKFSQPQRTDLAEYYRSQGADLG